MKKSDKRGNFIWDNLGWLLLILAGLVFSVILIIKLTGVGKGGLEHIFNLFRFGK